MVKLLLPQVVFSVRTFFSPFQHFAPAELWPVQQRPWTGKGRQMFRKWLFDIDIWRLILQYLTVYIRL